MLADATEANKQTYNIRFSTRESPLKKGDRVYVKRQNPQSKLDSKFIGPFRIQEVFDDKIRLKNLYNDKSSVVHMSHVLIIPESDVASITNNSVIPSVYPDMPCSLTETEELLLLCLRDT